MDRAGTQLYLFFWPHPGDLGSLLWPFNILFFFLIFVMSPLCLFVIETEEEVGDADYRDLAQYH